MPALGQVFPFEEGAKTHGLRAGLSWPRRQIKADFESLQLFYQKSLAISLLSINSDHGLGGEGPFRAIATAVALSM
jgi:hypothetical protein